MKTKVSIKFNSIEEYRDIERVLEGLGYVNDKDWNETHIKEYISFIYKKNKVYMHDDLVFNIYDFELDEKKTYNSLQEFLNDENNNL